MAQPSTSTELVSNTEQWQQGKDVLACNRHMFETKIAADVCFHVGGQDGEKAEKILAHKYVLISRSPVFERMFSPMWDSSSISTEAGGHGMRTIEVPDMDPQAFKELLRFMYTDEVNLNLETALGTLYAGQYYQIDSLLEKSKEFLVRKIDTESVCAILNQALLCNAEKLVLVCMMRIRSETQVIFKSTEFLDLSKDALTHVLTDDSLGTLSDTEVFDAAMRWATNMCIKSDTIPNAELLREHLGSGLFQIRFPTMTTQEFLEVSKSDVLKEDEKQEIFQCILGKFKGASRFKTEKRRGYALPKKSESVCVARLTPENIKFGPPSHAYRRHSSRSMFGMGMHPMEVEQIQGEKHAIRFTVNKECKLTGVGLFVHSAPFSMTLEVYKENHNELLCKVQQEHISSSEATPYVDSSPMYTSIIHMPVPMLMLPHNTYDIVAMLSGRHVPCAVNSVQEASSIENITRKTHTNLEVTFHSRRKTDDQPSKTSLDAGQFPYLYFEYKDYS